MKWSDLFALFVVLAAFALYCWRHRRARRTRREADPSSDGDPLSGGPWSPV
ncbi:MAG TPA: hypothetical protein VJB10_01265 [Candidatus Peribacteraceae bacterium]|nr:hypothetical protein [Candidatus Peribacteraceae bacterium]